MRVKRNKTLASHCSWVFPESQVPHKLLDRCFEYLQDDGVGGDNVLHLFGPGVHEAEPAAPQSDEGAIFDLELVAVCVDLLSHLQD